MVEIFTKLIMAETHKCMPLHQLLSLWLRISILNSDKYSWWWKCCGKFVPISVMKYSKAPTILKRSLFNFMQIEATRRSRIHQIMYAYTPKDNTSGERLSSDECSNGLKSQMGLIVSERLWQCSLSASQ